jgi:hypothetical protein
MKTPVASTETRGGRSTCVWEMPFLTAMAVPLFLSGGDRFDVSDNLGYRTSHEVLDVFLKTGPHLYVSFAAVYRARGAAS